MDITQFLIENGIADNVFRALNIATGLRLWELKTDAEKLERTKLYRKWRPITETKQNKRDELPARQAYDLSIAGIDPDNVEPRQMELDPAMFDVITQADEAEGKAEG